MKKNNMKFKPVRFELNEEVFTIDYTMNALIEIEDIYEDLNTAMQDLMKQKIKAVRIWLWAGLIENHPELTQKQVGSMINMGNLEYVCEVIGKGVQQDMPEAKEGEEKEGKN